MKSKALNRPIFALLILGLFFLFFLPPADPDLGWHLRCGQQLWEQGRLCAQNNFSVLMEGYYWPDARALYQGLIFPFYRLFARFGLSLVNSLLMILGAACWLSLSGKKEIRIITLPLILFFSWPVLGFGIRNQLVSLVFLIALLKLIELADQGKIRLFFLAPLVMLLWANSHGGFILGVIILLFFLFEKTVWLMIKRKGLKNYLPILGLVSFGLGVTLVNPFGAKIYLEAWRHFTVVPLSRLIAEWVPPVFWFQIVILLLAGVAIGVLYQTKKQSLTIFKFLALIFFAFLALKARRDLAFFFFFAVYILSSLKFKSKHLKPLALLASVTLFIFGLFFQLPRTLMVNSSWERFCQIRYACKAAEFLKKQPEKGVIFNTYEQGGFLIWQLPEYKVFIDGRMPAWPHPSGKSPYTIYLETLQTQPGWQETLKEYNINWLFIGPGTFMDLKIRENPESFGWQEVYRDKKAVIYKKT